MRDWFAKIIRILRDTENEPPTINDRYRATMLSVNSAAGSAGEILSGVLIGAIAENRGIDMAFYAGAIGLLFELVLFFVISKIRRYE